MALLKTDLPVPLRLDDAGVMRISNTRVSLDSIVTAYMEGASAEQIAEDFSTVELADIHAVICYYLRHRTDVEQYLHEQRRAADVVRDEIQPIVAAPGIRQRLLARIAQKE